MNENKERILTGILQTILTHCKNWFFIPGKIYVSDCTIKGGELTVDFFENRGVVMEAGQYYRIVGSKYNDGLHKNGEKLVDEEFFGDIWMLDIPPALVKLADEIAAWQMDHFDSDRKWQDVFAKQLEPYMKH